MSQLDSKQKVPANNLL